MARSPLPSPAESRIALATLMGLVLLSPWLFGGVHPLAARTIATVALAATLTAAALSLARRQTWPMDRDVRRIAGAAFLLWLLGALQLVPLPPVVHTALAPGSAAMWHPLEPVAAAVLGPGPHPISVYPTATARWLAFFPAIVGLALASLPALRGRERLLTIASLVIGSATLIAFYAFVARLWFGNLLFGRYESLVRPFGPFVSKNHFAGYAEMAALLAVGLAAGLAAENRDGTGVWSWIASPRANRVVAAWAAAAVLLLAVPVSLSRGGVLSLTLGLLVFALLRVASSGATRRLRLSLAAFGSMALLAAVLASVLPEAARVRIGTIVQGGGDGSSSYRLGLWRDTLRLAASSPLVGSGLGAYADAIPRFKTGAGDVRVEHAESDILEVAAETGLAGASLVAAALALVFRVGWRRVRADPHRLSRAVRTGGLAALGALAVHSLFDFNLRIPSNALLAALLAALVLAPVSLAQDRGDATRRAPGWPVGFVALTILPLLAALAVPWVDSRDFALGLSLRTGSLRRATAEEEVLSHLRHRPGDAEAWLVLAWLRLPDGDGEAGALARLAMRRDPADQRLSRAARSITDR